MALWETEDEYTSATQAGLPTPNDTPYRTPSRASRGSRKKSRSPVPSDSPPRHHNGTSTRKGSRDYGIDDSISPLDPRRFTPTLHANLVSEILTLRRDQEEKIRLIESLEATLHETRNETEELLQSLSATGKEIRSQKRQLALLEGGTSSALGELARERDEALEAAAETRKRLEAAIKKNRAHEDDADRTHDMWSRDKDAWDEERRKLDRRIHVAENRLKTVLEEVAAYQTAQQSVPEGASHEDENIAAGPPGDNASVRTMSLTNSIRLSLLGNGTLVNGMSLADELNLENEDDDIQTDNDGRESAMSARHKRTKSKDSMRSMSHIRNQSIDSLRRPGNGIRGRHLASQSVLDRLEAGIIEADETAAIKPEYVESGVQFSPPPSPQLKAVYINGPEVQPVVDTIPAAKLSSSPQLSEPENEANQARKRTFLSKRSIFEPRLQMISSSSQTVRDDPPSPPRTPKSPTIPDSPASTNDHKVDLPTITRSAATQTDEIQFEATTYNSSAPIRAAPLPPQFAIPFISVHPPTSRPTTPHTPLLPPHFKDAACQVCLPASTTTSSTAVQTEGIRVDERLALLPKHLQPSSITSTPSSPEQNTNGEHFTPIPGKQPPPRNPRRMESQQSIKDVQCSPPQIAQDIYPGNNDNGLLSKDGTTVRRPPRISSLFAGFDVQSSDEADDFAGDDLSDHENGIRTALTAPRPHPKATKNSKRIVPKSVPEDSKPQANGDSQSRTKQQNGHVSTISSSTLNSKLSRHDTDSSVRATIEKATMARTGMMRKATLIQNGIVAHNNGVRGSLDAEVVKEPPFPIPTRASSRKPPISVSAPSDGNRSPTPRGGDHWHRRGSKTHVRTSSIRKSRSAAYLPGTRKRRPSSKSPPPFSPSTEGPESPKLPPMPRNDITSPYTDNNVVRSYAAHRKQPSTNTAVSSNTGAQSVGSSVQATSVVDSIAQTMVGEWMFKYVRRRKSFGVSESNALEAESAVNGARHKRWVWLAPYERAVMWSSKQPTSGSALMGKSGRKLAIQSVLDVKDDNPPPKGATNIFNRSILILTPARALKFTATTRERHYTWLTAISFLAHSSQAVPEVNSAPPPIQYQQAMPPFEIPIPAKSRLRDSIRGRKPSNQTFAYNQSAPASNNGGGSVRTDDNASSIRGDLGPVSATGTLQSSRTFWHEPTNGSSAAPPAIPRFTERENVGFHGRKRSNTGSRIPPPLSFKGFSERPIGSRTNPSTADRDFALPIQGHIAQPSIAGMSIGTNGSSDLYQNSSVSQRSSSYGAWTNYGGPLSTNGGSVRTSDASARPGNVVNNFFDAVGTVRMEAFISPLAGIPGGDEDFYDVTDDWFAGVGKRRSRDLSSGGHSSFAAVGGRRRSRDLAYSSVRRRSRGRESFGRGVGVKDDWYSGSRTAGEEECGYRGRERDDPFKGF